MKVYVHEKGITLVGKGWEVLQKLKEYNKDYTFVSDWVRMLGKNKGFHL